MMRNRRKLEKGSALIEMAFMMPWIAFLFVGILDFGFYSYASIATQNAVRAMAIQDANVRGTLSTLQLCQIAKNEMAFVTNVAGMGGCAGTQGGVTTSTPIWVCAGILTNTSAQVCGLPAATCADCGLVNGAAAKSVQAVLTYKSFPMVPIPGVLTGAFALTRIAEARLIE